MSYGYQYISQKFLILFIIFCFNFNALSFEITAGLFKPDEKVQSSAGKEANDPYSPMISIGHQWDILNEYRFSPKLGYVQNKLGSNDRYSSYKIETYFLLYDFLIQSQKINNFFWRLGLGNFLKQTQGEGGTVTVPNGSGFATAYRPSGTSKSYTMSTNLGFDWIFHNSGSDLKYGLSGEMVYLDILDNQKRYPIYLLGVTCFF